LQTIECSKGGGETEGLIPDGNVGRSLGYFRAVSLVGAIGKGDGPNKKNKGGNLMGLGPYFGGVGNLLETGVENVRIELKGNLSHLKISFTARRWTKGKEGIPKCLWT